MGLSQRGAPAGSSCGELVAAPGSILASRRFARFWVRGVVWRCVADAVVGVGGGGGADRYGRR